MEFSIILPFIYVILAIILFLVYLNFSKKSKSKEILDKYSIDVIIRELKEYINTILYVGNNKKKSKKVENKELLKAKLMEALTECSCGDIVAKNYVKEHIKNWLINEYSIDANNINKIICFCDIRELTSYDKFDIVLYKLKQKHGFDAFNKLMESMKEDISVICEEDIQKEFNEVIHKLSYTDKLNIVVERIYQNYKGHGVIDELIDMNIDGISAGVSGLVGADTIRNNNSLKNYNSIWVFYKGRMVRLELLGFRNEAELERVCKNVYRYNNPGQLSAAKGYIANEMKDGSRVVVVRPPFSEGWAFFVRKFGMGMLSDINALITDENANTVIDFIKLLIHSAQVFGITGEQGCGKTTLLKSIIGFIPSSYTIRVQELVHELHLREVYPDRNIVSFKETSTVLGREGLDIQKKTDGTVSIIGEVATASVASWLVMASQVASKFTIFTHHAKTASHLVYALRNDLMLAGGFTNDFVAEHQVRSAIRFDIHMSRDIFGHRYIERISEILEKGENLSQDIIRRENNRYVIVNSLSNETYLNMYNNLEEVDRNILLAYEKN